MLSASLVFMNTNMAAAVATCATMLFTWIRYKKPDVSMTFNGTLAGLVAITAGCDMVSPVGAFFIGLMAGILVVLAVEFFDKVAKIDDPVGAVSVHGVCGAFGTICVGLFATDGGLFYGGGVRFLLVQLAGVVSVAVWVLVTMTIIFKVIDRLAGLRVPAEVEIDGLDIHEHGLASAYSGFAITDVSAALDVNENTDLGEDDYEKAGEHRHTAAVPVVRTEPADPAASSGMYKVTIIARLSRFDELKTAMNQLGVTGMTVTQVMGCGIQRGAGEYYRGVEMDATLLPKIKVEIVVSSIPVDAVIETAKKALYTGHVGDGKIFVYGVQRVVKVAPAKRISPRCRTWNNRFVCSRIKLLVRADGSLCGNRPLFVSACNSPPGRFVSIQEKFHSLFAGMRAVSPVPGRGFVVYLSQLCGL